jgi:beta-galactosidase/beta-glucuronidase
MNWKIQTLSANGWADIKCSIDGAPYEPELFSSLHDALVEAEHYADQCGFRVVTVETPSEFDLYE